MSGSFADARALYERRQPLFANDMALGREFPPCRFVISEETVARYAVATGCPPPGRDGNGVALAPQGFAMVYGRLSYMGEQYRPAPGGIAAGLSFEFVRPLLVGDVITSLARVTANEERKGRKYVTVQVESFNQQGELVSTMDFSFILPS